MKTPKKRRKPKADGFGPTPSKLSPDAMLKAMREEALSKTLPLGRIQEIANVGTKEAIALAFTLGRQDDLELYTIAFHHCSPKIAASRKADEGPIPFPFKCLNCGEIVGSEEEIETSFIIVGKR